MKWRELNADKYKESQKLYQQKIKVKLFQICFFLKQPPSKRSATIFKKYL